MENRKNILTELEKKINMRFKNKELLNIAVTHSSYVNQKKNVKFNERLEFLGDAVLQLCISEYLFNNFTDKAEGELTKIRSLIVCENSLHEISKKWGLGKYMNMSKGEELTGGRNRVSILADCVEAIIASIYIDAGLEEANKFILVNFKDIMIKAVNNEIILDYKTRLQEILQQNGDIDINYNLIGYEGPPHHRKFFIEVFVNNESKGNGEGFSKKEAEQNAAKAALVKLEENNE